MQGASSCPRDNLLMTSVISSSVPVPPGNAIKASPSSIILVLREGMSSVTINSVSLSCCSSASRKHLGSTPVTRPPAASTLSAKSPIRPLLLPPYTSALPLSPIQRPSCCTACGSAGSVPRFAPRYTVMFILSTSPSGSDAPQHRAQHRRK